MGTFWESGGFSDIFSTCYASKNRRLAEAFAFVTADKLSRSAVMYVHTLMNNRLKNVTLVVEVILSSYYPAAGALIITLSSSKWI